MYSSSKALNRWVMAAALAALFSGCRAPQLLPTSLLPAATSSDQPSFDRLLEIEDRQQASSRQSNKPASPGTRVSGLTSRRRPGSTSTTPRNARQEDTAVAQHDDDLTAGETVQDPDLQRTRQALQRYVADRQAASDDAADTSTESGRLVKDRKRKDAVGDEDLREESVVAFNLNDHSPIDLPIERPDTALADKRPAARVTQHVSDEPEQPRNVPRSREEVRNTPAQMASAESQIAPVLDEGVSTVGHEQAVTQTAPGVRRATYETAADRAEPLPGMTPVPSDTPVEADPSQRLESMSLEEHFLAIQDKLTAKDGTLSPRENTQRAAATRFLSLAQGELDAAMEPIPGLGESEQEYFRHQVQALYNFLDPAGSPEQSRRCSLVMLDERKALEQLAAVSALEVNNLSFCTEVMGFGMVTSFPASNFKANEEVLLYCELDNFVSDKTSAGYETKLDGSYEILDASGKKVYNDDLPEDSHLCRSRRRDYFIAYRLYMPAQIEAGKYTLKLTIHDMKGNKYGHAEIPFQIVL